MLSPDQLTVLAAELANAAYTDLLQNQEYEAIAALLNVQPEVPNPVPQGTKPRRVPFEEFIQVLKPVDVALLYQEAPTWPDEHRRYQQAGDNATARKLWNGIKRLAFDAATVTAIDALQGATEPDPDWTPTILGPSRATALGLPRVLPSDVQAVDQGGL